LSPPQHLLLLLLHPCRCWLVHPQQPQQQMRVCLLLLLLLMLPPAAVMCRCYQLRSQLALPTP
jgi:hypothetical protein